MSVQIALGAPATRVASRKLGPVAGSRSPPAASASGRLGDEHVREHVRQVGDGRQDRVVGLGLDRRRAGAEAVQQPVQPLVEQPEVVGAGVRYQVAPSNRSARACSTPAVSAPASGWPPTNRGSSCAATTARLVEPTSVTTQSPGAAGERLADARGERADRHRDEHRLGVRDRLGTVSRRPVERAALAARCRAPRGQVEAGDGGAEALAGGERDRAADQPDADDGDPQTVAPESALPATAAAACTRST